MNKFSPRKRRCFSLKSLCIRARSVFSAQAEVFLFSASGNAGATGFLRASGGVSESPKYLIDFLVVFSAQAEVFLSFVLIFAPCQSFLRASGGVSVHASRYDETLKFSPRKRRCFRHKGSYCSQTVVFSAQAEVFLSQNRISQAV